MKLKLIALVLTLTMTSWAQSTPSTPEQISAPADGKMTCACCDRTAATDQKSDQQADQRETRACMRHSSEQKDHKITMSCCSGKGAVACCTGKDAKSCAKKDQASGSCCEGSKKGEGHEMNCCSDKDGKTMTHDCYIGNQCGKHDHAAGN
jgi:hypothetical protein